MLLYIPLNNLFTDSTFQLLIVNSILAIVFISPILLMWISYNNKIEVIAEDEAKYEALVRYIARRRAMQNIFNQMELLYKNMLSFCDDYASQIDAFCNKEIPKLDENRVVFRFSDKNHFLYLLNEKELSREGVLMGNCVGGRSYKSKVKNKINFLSRFPQLDERVQVTILEIKKNTSNIKIIHRWG